MCTVIDHRFSLHVTACKDWTKKYDTRRSRVAWLLFFTRCDVFYDLLQYKHTGKSNLFVLNNKNSKNLLKDFGGHEKRKTSLLTWSDVDLTPSVSVSFNRSRSTTNENAHRSLVIVSKHAHTCIEICHLWERVQTPLLLMVYRLLSTRLTAPATRSLRAEHPSRCPSRPLSKDEHWVHHRCRSWLKAKREKTV